MGSGDDIANGGVGVDYILAGGGNDAIAGEAGDDMLDGGLGDDDIDGGSGNDIILGNLGNDLIDGGAGNDTIFGDGDSTSGAEDNDQIYGGSGDDFIDGGTGSDILHGDNGDDMLIAGAGDDFADGGLGDDNILGGAGNDVLLGGMDDDYIKGEAGADTLDGGFGNDILVGGAGANVMTGGEGDDIYVIGNDTLEANNVIADEAGADRVLLSWLTDTAAANGLVLEKVGSSFQDLKISYNGRVLATISDQFVAGHEVETIELANGKFINLAGVTYDATTHLSNTLTISNGTATTSVTTREQEVADGLLSQQLYWNNAYLQKLSAEAYGEMLANETGYQYYDGTQVITVSKSTGGFFSDKYTVFKINQAGNITGTNIGADVYTVMDTDDQAHATPFWNDNESVNMQVTLGTMYANAKIYYSTIGVYQYQDIEVGGVIVSSKVAGSPTFYTAGATINGQSITTRINNASTNNTVDTGHVLKTSLGNDLLVGAYWNESISGGSGNDVLAGNDGNDTLNGGDGEDWVFGGDGNDTMTGDNNDDRMFGGAGNDSISGGAGIDNILGNDGNDNINGDAGDDWIDAGSDNDSVNAGDGADIVFGGDGDDTLDGGNDNDVLHGGAGNDRLLGGAGNDTIYGGAGNDTIIGGSGTDDLNPDGQDAVSYEESNAAVNINLATQTYTGGYATGDVLMYVPSIFGSAYNDTIVGDNATNYFRGLAGGDTISGADGNDTIEGGAGADSLDGGAGSGDIIDYRNQTIATGVVINLSTSTVSGTSGNDAVGDTISGFEGAYGSNYNDTITGTSGDNHLRGMAGNDSLTAGDGADTLDGGAGIDTLIGGNGIDWADYQYSSAAVNINLTLTTAQAAGGDGAGDRFLSADIENLQGSAFNDTLSGGTASVANYIKGLAGDDTIIGGVAADTLDGGDGRDAVDYQTSSAAVTINMLTGTNTGGDAASDVLSNIEIIYGSAYADNVTANNNGIYVRGFAGIDTITGGTGADTLDGGVGADTLNGSAGIDLADYQYSSAAINVNLATNVNTGGDAASDSLSGIENVQGSANSDTITGDGNGNYIRGLLGSDKLYGGDGDDTLDGGDNTSGETLDGGNGIDWVDYQYSTAAVNINLNVAAQTGGDAQYDQLFSIENVQGSAFADTLRGNAGNNVLNGLDDDDVFYGSAGADTMDGGNGTADFVRYDYSTSRVYVNLATNVNLLGDAEGDKFFNIEKILGTSTGDDTLIGTAGNDYLNGWGGDDWLKGGAGADSIYGDTGFDWLDYTDSSAAVNINISINAQTGGDAQGDYTSNIDGVAGSAFNDTLKGHGAVNWLLGLGGDDTIFGDAGVDTLDGGDGVDAVSYAGSAAVTVNMSTGTNTGGNAAGDLLSNFEIVIGSSYADTITANDSGMQLYGMIGNDSLVGGAGADTLEGGAGADTLNGNGGVDTASYQGSTAAVTINLITNINTGGDAVSDSLSNIENITGSNYNDTITGSTGANYLRGILGNDSLSGDNGDDTLEGGDGADTLNGGAGIDTVTYENSPTAVNINLGTGSVSGGEATGDSLSSIENVRGSAFNDTLTGDSVGNLLEGMDGDDTLTGGVGADTLNGGNGVDVADYSASGAAINLTMSGSSTGGDAAGDVLTSIEVVYGSVYNDTIAADNNGIYMRGMAGNDSITGGTGNDMLDGGTGADTVNGGAGSDTADYRNSSAAVNVNLTLATAQSGGDAAGDILSNIENVWGSANNDTINGDNGANIITGGAGADTLNGGSGIDTVDYSTSSAAINVSLILNVAQSGGDATGDILSNFENVIGSSQNDTILGDTGANDLRGNDGNDSIAGGDGDDTLDGDAGSDTLDGGTDIDTLKYDQSDSGVNIDLTLSSASGGWATGDIISNFENITGSAYNDVLKGDSGVNIILGLAGNDFITGSVGADTLNGGDGYDTANYQESSASIVVNMLTNTNTGGDANGDSLTGFEAIYASENADTVTADNNGIYIRGFAGNDSIIGGTGADSLDGGTGADTLSGGSGNDTADYQYSSTAVNVNLMLATAQAGGDAAGDILSSIENVVGSAYNDTITGDSGANIITGGAGADTLGGGFGIDTVSYADSSAAINVSLALTTAQSGGDAQGDILSGFENVVGSDCNDIIFGNSGANELRGGLGNDWLDGGSGDDIYVFDTELNGRRNVDTIATFSKVGGDTDIIQLDDDIFTAIGSPGTLSSAAFYAGTAAHDADDRIIYDIKTGGLFYDADGDGAGAQIQIAIIGTVSHPTLANTDFTVVAYPGRCAR